MVFIPLKVFQGRRLGRTEEAFVRVNLNNAASLSDHYFSYASAIVIEIRPTFNNFGDMRKCVLQSAICRGRRRQTFT
jgi:hypothetical protein